MNNFLRHFFLYSFKNHFLLIVYDLPFSTLLIPSQNIPLQNSHAYHSSPLGHDENLDFFKHFLFPVPSKWKNMPVRLYNERKMNSVWINELLARMPGHMTWTPGWGHLLVVTMRDIRLEYTTHQTKLSQPVKSKIANE